MKEEEEEEEEGSFAESEKLHQKLPVLQDSFRGKDVTLLGRVYRRMRSINRIRKRGKMRMLNTRMNIGVAKSEVRRC